MTDKIIDFFKKLLTVRSVKDLIVLILSLVDLPDIGDIIGPIIGPVIHYGCPNSKRTSKLHLQKALHK